MDYDIVIIGAGQAGLSFACSLMNTGLNVLMVEKREHCQIANPQPDGREIALTHLSVAILKKNGVWPLIAPGVISPINEARVFNGHSGTCLQFSARQQHVDALGYLIPNYLICRALFQRVQQADNVHIMTEVIVEDVINNSHLSQVRLSDNTTVTSRLVVAADSRFSSMRRKMGIAALMDDFSKVMIVTQMQHEKPHQHIALECFHFDKTLALLPMAGNQSSVVLTVDTDKAAQVSALSEQAFNSEITLAFGNQFGQMQQKGERFSYPLVGVYARRLIATRFALIGDAAVGMHPVTAHGINSGLRGQDILATSIKQALARNQDIGSQAVLSAYENKHIHLIRMMYFGTNGIVALFTNNSTVAKKLRQFVLMVTEHCPPIKYLITRQLTQTKRGWFLPF